MPLHGGRNQAKDQNIAKLDRHFPNRLMKRSSITALIAFIPCFLFSKKASIDYSRDILPILSHNCFECHGPDEAAREANLRLDNSDGAYANLVGAVAIAPGDPEGSELVYRINTKDGDERMPPKDSKKSLTGEEKKLLQAWIKEGAEYDEHWAFLKPEKRTLPNRSKHPIDAFVLDRLKKEGLKPSEPADPYTLVRRIFLDLIGLPPTPQEIDTFVRSHKKNEGKAVDNLIDDLMQKPAFGEKWARHWLDVARYADSNGFEKDKPRDQWIYRDWVINALNDDLPYDQFLIEQLAGDLLPNPTQEQIIATGFMRNGMINEEGAIIPEEFRLAGIVDRMDTFGKAAIGLTLQCAQCHSHKFDPISHDEYYGLFAFFNETHEAKSWVYSDKQLEKIDSIRRQVEELEQSIRDQIPTWKQDLDAWKQTQIENASNWKVWDSSLQDWNGGLNHPTELQDHSILTLGHPSVSGFSITEGPANLPRVSGMRIEALTHGDQPFQGPGRSYWGTFAISEVELFLKKPGDEDWNAVELKSASADFETEVSPLKNYFKHEGLDPNKERTIGPAGYLVDGDKKTAWAPDRGPIIRHAESVAVITFKEALEIPEGSHFKVQLVQNHGGSGNGRENQMLGRYRFSFSDDADPLAPSYHHAATLALEKHEDDLTTKDANALFRAWIGSIDELKETVAKIAKLEASYPEAITSVLHTTDTPPELARTTHLLDRGAWDKPKQQIARTTPAILPALSSNNPSRLDLALWVTDKNSPTTARVQVNRIWQACFGNGLVATPEDLGNRTPKPEYLDVLDWLAVDFMENDWSQKKLIKTILTSKTYQQSSIISKEHLEKDLRNTFLARGPRFRTEAEVLRDVALAASGLLTQKIGGESIFPPVPDSVIKYNYVVPDYWYAATDENRYRRSLYMFKKRSMPDPVLTSFDAPNGDVSCTSRVRSNSPLSALTSLNETIFVESSQALAQRILKEGGNRDEERVNYAYLLTTGRPATDWETREILNLIESQQERLAEGWLGVREIAFKDTDNIPELPEGVTPRDAASWTIASRVLLNLDETLTKN